MIANIIVTAIFAACAVHTTAEVQCQEDGTCCKTAAKCGEYELSWILAGAVGEGCADSSTAQFFDTKKAETELSALPNEEEIKATCCTPYSDAVCSDWATVLASCGSGTYLTGSVSAPGQGDNGNTMSQDSFNELCCAETAKCSSLTCSSGYQLKSDAASISCSSDAASCTDDQCCTAIPTCLDYSVSWIAASLVGGGCAADNSNKFFDLKKSGDQVASPQGEDEVTAACCTAYSDAVCSDWAPLMPACSPSKYVKTSSAAPPDADDGKTLSDDAFSELCCVTYGTCSDDEASSSSRSGAPLAFLIVISLLRALSMMW